MLLPALPLPCLIAVLAWGASGEESTLPYRAGQGTATLFPRLMYGTAWKKEDTARLTEEALLAGFSGVDTANQPKHYNESGVGEALKAVFSSGRRSRDDVWVQSKFTPPSGQDPKTMPYSAQASIAEQVEESFRQSLEHLGVAALDSLILHSPFETHLATLGAWRTMEDIQRRGGAKLLGISNVDAKQLSALLADAAAKPAIVQNRFRASPDWDAAVRGVCAEHGLLYQGFSVLTANRGLASEPVVVDFATKLGKTPQQVQLKMALQMGIVLLSGPRNRTHMRDDLSLLTDAMGSLDRGGLPEAASQWEIPEDMMQQLRRYRFDARAKIQATFHNWLTFRVKVFWTNHEAQLVPQGDIYPGSKLEIGTFHSHKFVIQTSDGVVVKRWRADAALGASQVVDVAGVVKSRIRSQLDEPVELFWKAHKDAQLVSQGRLSPGGRDVLRIDARHGHQFLGKTDDGRVVAQWVATADKEKDGWIDFVIGSEL